MQSITPITVRYGETDMMGVVHHANYVLYFEDARTKFLEDMGYPYARVEEEGLMSPVVSVELHYGKSLRYGQNPVVLTKIADIRPMKVTFSYQVFDSLESLEAGSKPCCTGTSVHCLVDAASFKPVSMKKAAPELYRKYVEACQEG